MKAKTGLRGNLFNLTQQGRARPYWPNEDSQYFDVPSEAVPSASIVPEPSENSDERLSTEQSSSHSERVLVIDLSDNDSDPSQYSDSDIVDYTTEYK